MFEIAGLEGMGWIRSVLNRAFEAVSWYANGEGSASEERSMMAMPFPVSPVMAISLLSLPSLTNAS